LSVNVPSALALQVPETLKDPVTWGDGQVVPRKFDRSSWPVTVRHDDVTSQVPTTSPPHAASFEQDPPAPPLPELPPLPSVFELLLAAPPALSSREDEEEIAPPDLPLPPSVALEPLVPPGALPLSPDDLQPGVSTANASKAAAVLKAGQWRSGLVMKTSRQMGVVVGLLGSCGRPSNGSKDSFLAHPDFLHAQKAEQRREDAVVRPPCGVPPSSAKTTRELKSVQAQLYG
jgi:hypothetical protein